MKAIILKSIGTLFLIISFCQAQSQTGQPYYYQLKIYHLTNENQEKMVDEYLENAYLPALHRNGIDKAGVFKQVENDSAEQLVYVFIPFKSLTQFEALENAILKDKDYLQNGKTYLNTPYDNPPYQRIESILMKAFKDMPAPEVPKLTGDKSQRIYELRSYESATESYFINKVKMFNDGDEIGIFSRLGFNAIFYAEVISGSEMPNLMYMTSFNNKQERDERWQAFRDDPAWVKLKAIPEYQNNVSRADIIFLYPTDYSDL